MRGDQVVMIHPRRLALALRERGLLEIVVGQRQSPRLVVPVDSRLQVIQTSTPMTLVSPPFGRVSPRFEAFSMRPATLVEEVDVPEALELQSDLDHGAERHGGAPRLMCGSVFKAFRCFSA